MRDQAHQQRDIALLQRPPAWTHWNTSDVRHDDRFAYFREAICQTFLSYTPEKPDGIDLKARIDKVQLDNGWMGRIEVTPHTVVRTKLDLAKSAGDDRLSLTIQLSGGAALQVGGKHLFQRNGDVTLVDPARISRLDLFKNETYSALAIMVDRSILQNGGKSSFDDFLSFSCRPLSEALVGCLSLIARRFGSGNVAELGRLYDAATSLVAANLALGDEDFLIGQETTRSAREGMLTAIKLFVHQHLADPDLSPTFVAERFGVSVRYLHKVFANEDHTFGTLILALRLEKVHNDLRLAANSHIPVSEIAYRWGFRDLTSFHRNFKHRFYETPGNLRSSIRY